MSVDIGASQTKSEPNVVPLCDILLVLLIIFMVITPTLQKGIDIKLPETVAATEGSIAAANTIMLVLEGDLSIKINSLPVDINQLESQLRTIYQTRQEKTIFIRADESIPYKEVLRVIDIARGAGIDVLGLIPEHYKTGQ